MASYYDLISEEFKRPEYLEAQKKASEAQQALADLQAQAPGYLDRESQKLETADPVLQQMLGQRAKQQGELFSKPMEAREQYKDIFDPTKRSAMVSQAIGSLIGKLGGTSGLIEQQRGFAGQRAQTSLDALLAQTGLAQTAAQTAGSERDILRDILSQSAGANYDQQFAGSGGTSSTAAERQAEADKNYYLENAAITEDAYETLGRMDSDFVDWFMTNRAMNPMANQAGTGEGGKYTKNDIMVEKTNYYDKLPKELTYTQAVAEQAKDDERVAKQDFADTLRANTDDKGNITLTRQEAYLTFPELEHSWINDFIPE